MKAVEIRKLSESELNKKLFDLQSELFNLRFQMATGQLENPAAIGNVKKDIARVKTIQTEDVYKRQGLFIVGELMKNQNGTFEISNNSSIKDGSAKVRLIFPREDKDDN